MIQLSNQEVDDIAWKQVLFAAEASFEDWWDEEGLFTEEDADRIYDRGLAFIKILQDLDIADIVILDR